MDDNIMRLERKIIRLEFELKALGQQREGLIKQEERTRKLLNGTNDRIDVLTKELLAVLNELSSEMKS